MDTHETKLPTYWNTPFNKICLGMKIGQELKSVVINHQARSLYSLIADGKYRATSLGRNTWKKLIGSRASLQPNCNKEGFNVLCTDINHSKATISIVANNQNVRSSCVSRIGFIKQLKTFYNRTPTDVCREATLKSANNKHSFK